MKQYKSFVISQWNLQGLRSSAFGLKSNNDLFDEFKGRGRGREGDLPSDCPARLWGSKKAPWSDTGKDIRGGILIWLKAKYTNSIELDRQCENYVWLKLKKTWFPIPKTYGQHLHPSNWSFKDQTFTDLVGAITHFQPQGNILVGDLNAHTAEETHNSNTNGDKCMNNKTNISLTLPLRNNYDKITNRNGEELLTAALLAPLSVHSQ